MMKLFITTNWPPDYFLGGVVYSGSELFRNLNRIDQSWRAFTTGSIEVNDGTVDISKYYWLPRLGLSLTFAKKVYLALRENEHEIVFINGTVTFPTVVSQIFSVLLKKKYVVSLRGSLEPWRINHKQYKKFLYYKLVVLPLLKRSVAFHVTGHLEEFYAKEKFPNQKILLSPNGIQHLNPLPNNNVGKIKLLFLSRISKEKGLETLLELISRINNNDINCELTIIGPNAPQYFSSSVKVKVLSGVYGEAKLKHFKESDIFILPSHSENFGNVILESLSHARAVITTNATPWLLNEQTGGFVTSPDTDKFIGKISEVIKYGRDRIKKVGLNGLETSRDYLWENIAKDLNIKLNEL